MFFFYIDSSKYRFLLFVDIIREAYDLCKQTAWVFVEVS